VDEPVFVRAMSFVVLPIGVSPTLYRSGAAGRARSIGLAEQAAPAPPPAAGSMQYTLPDTSMA